MILTISYARWNHKINILKNAKEYLKFALDIAGITLGSFSIFLIALWFILGKILVFFLKFY
jgi:hypothetical protein